MVGDKKEEIMLIRATCFILQEPFCLATVDWSFTLGRSCTSWRHQEGVELFRVPSMSSRHQHKGNQKAGKAFSGWLL